MDHAAYADADLRGLLDEVRAIAVVGASADAARPSHAVLRFLAARRYRVFPVNPGLAGGTILGLPVFGRLADLPGPVDMVDVFRRSEAVGGVVDEALALDPRPKAIWMQLGVRDAAAAARAEAAGLRVVMDRCLQIEVARLSRGAGR